MAKKDPRVDAYIANAAPFAVPILKKIRKAVHAGCPEVEETIKWSFPHFDYHGLMCGMAAFKQHCALGFWKAKLIFPGYDPADREEMGSFGKIRTIADLPDEATLIAHARKAAELNARGVKLPAKPREKRAPIDVPDYFLAALKTNAKARKTFEAFSPSHQREYIEWLTEAKREKTRQQRLATALDLMAQGKSRNWKYASKK